ncbi:tRNA pseudouridine(55) synthase TruB [Buchnera aphidicola]|uniref:tRNA pseudouridine(55) synthase TruB n=1 Tax=Buchnera aphidicola TaxID=9 RepID=UPI0022380F2E|nr:tRNA pseudouridine(55) synthase TruB [Buchnera aphidicola]MCW5197584.1 tRNA pseudouridine(55) synthase TruB [Buchnera aphidicola (Chaitophorus viminalis)]
MIFNHLRNIHGVFLLDKPTGISSNKALQITKKIFLAKKAGHTGSLDPLATGILPICFGEATKFSKYVIKSNKKYRVIAKLGEQTSTADSYGEIINVISNRFSSYQYWRALDRIREKRFQIPPIFSAIKYQGIRLYKYARKGIRIPLKARPVKIYKLSSLYRSKNIIELEISCSSGTYIRSIINDLGNFLKCGAHVIFLRRIKVSSYSCCKSITLDQLNFFKNKYYKKSKKIFFQKLQKLLIPINSMVSNFNKIYISLKETLIIQNGKFIKLFTKYSNGLICIMNTQKIFIGLGKIRFQIYLYPYRLIKKDLYSNYNLNHIFQD